MLNSKMLLFDNRNLIDNLGSDYTISGCCIERGRYQDIYHYDCASEQRVLIVCAGAAIYRRELFDKVGLFDEHFFFSYEDVDLSLRAYWAGFKAYYCPNAIVYHKLQATRKNNANLNAYYNIRNNSLVWYKNIPFHFRLKYLLPRLLYLLGTLIISIRNKRLKIFIRAKCDALMIIRKYYHKSTKPYMNCSKIDHNLDNILNRSFLVNKIEKALNYCR